jgi:glutamate racemase
LTDVVAFGSGGEDLLQRTQEKIGALLRRKQDVRVAVLACNTASGGAAVGRRAQLARTLLGAVTSTGRGRMILSASGHASHRLRVELLALAGALTEELRGTTATVTLWFTEASHGNAVRIVETRTATKGR